MVFYTTMVKAADKLIYIQDLEGERIPFDPVELQARLIGCFLAAGLRDSSFFAEDIALAVEFTLLNSNRPEPVFGKGELAAAVIRMLEETGFPEVAALYRKNGGEQRTTLNTDAASVGMFLKKFLACSEPVFDRVTGEVAKAFGKLGIPEAEPHLLLELARHYERKNALEVFQLPEIPRKTSATAEELIAVLPEEAGRMVEQGILKIDPVNEIFPRIHLFFRMVPFAEKNRMAVPVTEMELEPQLYEAARVLEAARAAVDDALASEEPLPVHLSIPDMSSFITGYFGADWKKSKALSRELADILGGEFANGVYKLNLN